MLTAPSLPALFPAIAAVATAVPAAAVCLVASLGGWLVVIGWTASVVGVVSCVPQAWRHWRTRDVSGSPLSAYAMQIVTAAWWISYEFAVGAVPAAVASLGWLVCLMVSLWVIAPTASASTRRRQLLLALAAASVAVVLAFVSPPLVGVIANLVSLYRWLPVCRGIWADRCTSLAGISPAAWWLGVVQALLWAVYGTLASLPLVVAGALPPLLVSVWVLALLARRPVTTAPVSAAVSQVCVEDEFAAWEAEFDDAALDDIVSPVA